MLTEITAIELANGYRELRFSPVEVVDEVLDRVNKENEKIRAFYEVDDEGARASAKLSEARWAKGCPLSQLDGVPISIKDQIPVKGMHTCLGLPLEWSSKAEQDGPSAACVRKSGAVILGKTTMPEFGVAGVTESVAWGVTRNPLNLELTAGGSSGGAVAAVAAGMGPLALGTDGAGSIRMPCSFTNLVGLKPTYGRVPFYPFPNNKTVIGPIAKTVEDAALLFSIISQFNPQDWTALPPEEMDYFKNLDTDVSGLRAGIAFRFGEYSPLAGVRDVLEQAPVERLFKSVVSVEVPIDDIYDTWMRLSLPRLASLIDNYPEEIVTMLSPAIMELIQYGRSVTAAEIMEAEASVHTLNIKMQDIFRNIDILLCPAVPYMPFKVGSFYPDGNKIAYEAHRFINFTAPFNLTQQPAISVPCGFTPDRLPVGLQMVGKKFSDLMVLQAARAFEKEHW